LMETELIFRFLLDIAPWLAAYLIISLSLNLEYGFAGIPNFGKVLCVSGGAFIVGALPGQLIFWIYDLGGGMNYFDNHAQVMTRINSVLAGNIFLGISMLVLSLAAAILFGAALGFISSIPSIRLREEYLAMTLLAMGEILILIGDNYKGLIGGTLGVFVPSFLAGIPSTLRGYIQVSVIVAIAAAIYLFVHVLTSSPYGRLLRAIRDNEDLVLSLGRDVAAVRRKTIILAGALAGLAGALLALNSGAVNARNFSRANHTFIPWVMVLVGGAANNAGTAIGVILFIMVSRLIDVFKRELQGIIPFDVVWLTPILLSISLLLVMFYRPQGMLREKRLETLKPFKLLSLTRKTGNR
jgi:branched-chain amino acid transport system permease protein